MTGEASMLLGMWGPAAWRSQAGGKGAVAEIRTPVASPRRADFRRGPLATRA